MLLGEGVSHPEVGVKGEPTRLQIAQVMTVNPDGTIDAKPIASRATKSSIPVPGWWQPKIGERCLLAFANGDPRTPVCLGYFAPADGSLAGPQMRYSSVGTVTGSRGANAALTSLLAALNAAGLVVDNTTA